MPVNISNVPYSVAEVYHYNPRFFLKHVAPKLIGPRGGKWQDDRYGRMSCAVRLSIALYRAGVRFTGAIYTWTRPSGAVYPSYAGEYPDLLLNRVTIAGTQDIGGKKGVVYFGPFSNAGGHVTLWDGTKCHHEPQWKDSWWGQVSNTYFWQMA